MKQRRRQILVSFIPGLVSLVAGAYLVHTARWLTFGVPTTGEHFGDLKVILFASECAQAETNWSIATEPCRPEMAIYNYPSLWAKGFALLGLGSSSAAAFALVLIALFSAGLAMLAYLSVRPGNLWFPVVALSVVGISPPVLLGFERGNIDLLIFGLTVASISLLIARLPRLSGITLAVATFLKIFPFGAALMFVPLRRHRRSTFLVYGATVALGLLLIGRDLPTIYARTPALDGASFGSALLPLLAMNHMGYQGHIFVAKLIGLLIFGLFAVALYVLSANARDPLRLRSMSDRITSDHRAVILVLAGSGSFLVAYLIGPSFDYRLITLIPLIAGLARLGTRSARIAAIFVLAQMLLSYSTFVGAAEYFSDVMLVIIAPALLILAIRLLQELRRVTTPA